MTYGKSVRIFLSNGVATGIRHAEIVNWTGQAIACPRARLADLAAWSESRRPGVYFLISGSDGDGRGRVYIGESENVHQRLVTHDKNKDFWNEVVLFTSKDENLTKGHVKYLESRLVQACGVANRVDMENGNDPGVASLPRADRDSMDEFLSQLRVVLATLGHRFLEPLTKVTSSEAGDIGVTANPVLGTPLSFSFKGLTARGLMTDEGFLVLAGSAVVAKHVESTPESVQRMRDRAVAEGQLVVDDDHLRLQVDTPFNSASGAAAFVSGSNRNGRDTWRSAEGKTLKELEDSGDAVLNFRDGN